MAPLQRGGRSKERAFLRDSNWVGVIMIVLYPLSRVRQAFIRLEDPQAGWMTRAEHPIEVTQTEGVSPLSEDPRTFAVISKASR